MFHRFFMSNIFFPICKRITIDMKILLFIVSIFFFMSTVNYFLNKEIQKNISCAHIDTVLAYKFTHGSKGHNHSSQGKDISCYTHVTNNGETRVWEFWNIGECEDTNPVEVQIADYTCH